MSAALLTRDGMWSPAQAQIAREDAALGTLEVDAADVQKYAWDNKIDLIKGEPISSQLARVNVQRREWQLPVFVVRQQNVRPVSSPAPPASSAAAPKTVPARAPISSSTGAAVEPIPDTIENPQPRAENACDSAASTPADHAPIFADQDEFLRHVTEFNGTVTGLVTPEIAGWILDLNTANRPLMRRKLQRFFALLRAGTWINTGEPLIISREAILNDGQHRLTGIRETGIAAECDIRFGIPREAFAATGTGTPRNASDVLAIAGLKNSHLVSAMAKIVHRYDAGTMGDVERALEPSVVLETATCTPLIGEIADAIRLSKFKPTKMAPYGAMLVAAAEAASKEKALAFHRLVEAGKAEDTDPTAQLHVRLRNAAMEKTRLRPVEICVLTTRAWNAWLQGRALTRLIVTEDDRTNAGFPPVLGA